jgi:hypothetical protein
MLRIELPAYSTILNALMPCKGYPNTVQKPFMGATYGHKLPCLNSFKQAALTGHLLFQS